MSFWNDPLISVKRSYRWLVYFGNLDPMLAKKVQLPGWSMTETKHSFLNHTFWYPGRIEWTTVDVTFVDPAFPDSTSELLNILKQSGFELPETYRDSVKTISKSLAATSQGGLGTVTIEQIDENGSALSKWQLVNAWLKDVKLSELSYEDDGITEITATVRYDFAKYTAMSGTPVSPFPADGSTPSD